jgi:hypothetical protein
MALWSRKKSSPVVAVALQLTETQTSARLPAPTGVIKDKPKKKKNNKRSKLPVQAAVKRRFEGYLQKGRKCWSWKGSHTTDGYAQFWVNDTKVVKAHRFAYEIYVRQLGKRERLRNHCANKQCVNPACWAPFVIGARKRRVGRLG